MRRDVRNYRFNVLLKCGVIRARRALKYLADFSILTANESFMKNALLLGFLISFAPFVYSQKVFSVDYASQADVKVFVVDYESQCDLKVFKVDYSSQAGNNDGAWFFVDYESQADKKIFFVDYESQADLKIFFVDYSSQAGWKSSSKKHLMY